MISKRGDMAMTKAQEKVLVAALCGLVVAATAAFVVQPSVAAQPARPAPTVIEGTQLVLPIDAAQLGVTR